MSPDRGSGFIGGPTWEERDRIPYHTTDLTGARVLVLAPHPDDESFACGGALRLHAEAGDEVRVVVLTDGGKGDMAGAWERQTYVRTRENEARRACEILGVQTVTFWGIPDRRCVADADTVGRLVELLRSYEPGLIYVPSPRDRHPDHRAAVEILWRALPARRRPLTVALYEIYTPLEVNALVDITKVLDWKKRACDAYRSQLEHLAYTDFALALNRYRALTVAATCRYAEGYHVLDDSDLPAIRAPMAGQRGASESPRASPATDCRGGGEGPLVSVLVRTRDRARLLRDALASVEAQTYPHVEVVVVNDGGTSVERVLADFNGSLAIRRVEHDSSRGRSAAANAGLRAARGRYVNFLDDDDLFHPHHVEKLVEVLERTGEDAVYSDCVQRPYRQWGTVVVPTGPAAPYKGIDFDRERLWVGNYIPLMTVMFRRSLIDDVGEFDPTLDVFEDWDYWIRMARRTSFRRVPGISAEYRVFPPHDDDYAAARSVIYRKHADLATLDRIARRLDAVEAELDTTRAAARGPPAEGAAGLRRLRTWILRVIRGRPA